MSPHKNNLILTKITVAIATFFAITVRPIFASYFLASPSLAQNSPSQSVEANKLMDEGLQHFNNSEYESALASFQQALNIYRNTKNFLGEGEALRNIGNVYYWQEKYDKAVEFLQQALTIARKYKERTLETKVLLHLGDVNYYQGKYNDAITFLQQGLTIARAIPDRSLQAVILASLGQTYDAQGQSEQAIKSYQQSLDIAKQLNNVKGAGSIAGGLAIVYERMGNYPKAIELNQYWLSIARELKDLISESAALSGLARAYQAQDNYPAALQALNQRLVIIKQFDDQPNQQTALTILGNVYTKLGNYSQALQSHQQSLELAKVLNRQTAIPEVLNNIGNSYAALGKYQDALSAYQSALQLAEKLNLKLLQRDILNNLGVLFVSNLGDYSQGVEYYQKSLAVPLENNLAVGEAEQNKLILESTIRSGEVAQILDNTEQAKSYYVQSLSFAQKLGSPSLEVDVFNHLGSLSSQMSKYSEAIKYYQQGWQIAEKIDYQPGSAAALRGLGATYDSLKNYEQASKNLQQALQVGRKIKDPYAEVTALNNLGLSLFNSGKVQEAEKILRDGIAVQDNLRKDLTDANKISIFEQQARTYRLLQRVLVKENKVEAALEVSEQGRARAFLDLLDLNLLNRAKINLDAKIINLEEVKQIAKSHNSILVEYSIVYNTTEAEQQTIKVQESELFIWVVKPTGEISFRRQKLDLLQQQKISLSDLITRNIYNIATGINRDVQSPTTSNLITFVAGDRVSISSKNSIAGSEAYEVQSVNNQTQKMKVRLPSWEAGVTIEVPIADATKVASVNAQNQDLQQLYQLLIQPIADLLPKDPNARVIFVPQGKLFLVPFVALQDAGKKYLIEKHTILTVPSIQVLDRTKELRRQVAKNKGEALIVGNPTMPRVRRDLRGELQQLESLPNAEKEANAIAQILATKPLIGNQATKAQILSKISQARLIHFATHGLLDEVQGLGSAIALAPSGNDDGLLTAKEILDLKLNAELVVLSACNTGVGRITGDGVIGLSRSLISAGVPSAIVSLWKVPDDHTASLMTEFYQQLQSNPDKAQALRQAMLKTMKQRNYPTDWAAFTLIGEAEL